MQQQAPNRRANSNPISRFLYELANLNPLIKKMHILEEAQIHKDGELSAGMELSQFTKSESELLEEYFLHGDAIYSYMLIREWLNSFKYSDGIWNGPLFGEKPTLTCIRLPLIYDDSPWDSQTFVDFVRPYSATIHCKEAQPVIADAGYIAIALWGFVDSLVDERWQMS